MKWVAQHAADHGCHRIDWPVKATNAGGIAFYKELGAQQVVERSLSSLGDNAGLINNKCRI